MRKLFYSLCVLGLFGLSSCMTEMQESQVEINDALLKEIGHSESYITMSTTLGKSFEVYGTLDRDLYVSIMEEAGIGVCEVKEKGIPPRIREMEGAVEYINLMIVYCDALKKFNEAYPFFWDLPEETRVRAVEYRNQAIGFEPADVLTKN